MDITIIPGEFAICKIKDLSHAPLEDPFIFVSKTDKELSLVCKIESLPADTLACEKGWRAIRLEGTLDLSLVGVLAKLSGLLAGEGISVFVISTFDTDYLLVKEADLRPAVSLFCENGCRLA